MMPSFEQYRDDYATRWASMQVRPEWASRARAAAEKVIAGRRHYEPVSGATGVPWHVIGIIHQMECGGSFRGHLHNGDPLTGRTYQVPKGRPVAGKPPFSWNESAIDALRYDGLDKVADWGPERLAWCLEKFNGWGYRGKGVPSAYLWSGSNQYARGKYIRDGVWSSTAVSEQVGGLVILKAMLEIDPSLSFGDTLPVAAAEFPKAIEALPSPKEVHLEAHAELNASSWNYSLLGRGLQALRWVAPGGVLGAAGKKAMEGGSTDGTNVIPQATDLLGQVGAAAHLIAQYGLPFLGIALVGVLLLEGIRYLQRTSIVGGKP